MSITSTSEPQKQQDKETRRDTDGTDAQMDRFIETELLNQGTLSVYQERGV